MKSKISGSTILEAIVAMTIMTILFGLCTLTYNQLLDSTRIALKLKSVVAISDIRIISMHEQRYYDEDIPFEEFTISRRILKYHDMDKVREVIYTANNKEGQLLYQTKELLYFSEMELP